MRVHFSRVESHLHHYSLLPFRNPFAIEKSEQTNTVGVGCGRARVTLSVRELLSKIPYPNREENSVRLSGLVFYCVLFDSFLLWAVGGFVQSGRAANMKTQILDFFFQCEFERIIRLEFVPFDTRFAN